MAAPFSRQHARPAHQQSATWCADQHVDRVDDREEQRDLLPCGRRQWLSGEPFEEVPGDQLLAVRHTVVIEHRSRVTVGLAGRARKRAPRASE
jgi:hypothetical protein